MNPDTKTLPPAITFQADSRNLCAKERAFLKEINRVAVQLEGGVLTLWAATELILMVGTTFKNTPEAMFSKVCANEKFLQKVNAFVLETLLEDLSNG